MMANKEPLNWFANATWGKGPESELPVGIKKPKKAVMKMPLSAWLSFLFQQNPH